MKRLSANQLAKFMVSSDTGRVGIIAEAKSDNTAMAIRYKDARDTIKTFLTNANRDRSILDAAIGRFAQAEVDMTLTNFARSDAANSKQALEAFDRLRNQIGGYNYLPAPTQQPRLEIGDVSVSITLDALIHRNHRGEEQVGGVLFRFTQADDETEAATTKRREMGAYAATLVHMQVTRSFATNRQSHHAICFATDVQFQEAIPAPRSYARRARDMENACRFISALWDGA